MGSVLDEQVERIRKEVGPSDHVICALSGGVDSAVAAVLVHRAIGDRLHCVFVDHGLLRFKEQERVMKMFKDALHLPVECVDASFRFLSKLDGVSDPEKKRKIIGAEFIAVFDEAAERIGTRARAPPGLSRARNALSRRHRIEPGAQACGDDQVASQRRRTSQGHEVQAHRAACESFSKTKCARSEKD